MEFIDTIIWDLDNTLYKYTGDSIIGWNEMTAEVVIERGLDMDYETAFELALRGYKEHRNSTYFFTTDHGFEHGDIHVDVNYRLCEKHIVPCVETPDLIRMLPENTRHIILTFAIQDWARRVLKHTALDHFFDTDMIIGAENYGFEDKANSPRGIKLALDKAGSEASKTLFVEDTLPNLKIAKEHTGVQTVYLHHDRPYDAANMDFVDLIVRDTPELLRTLHTRQKAA